MTGFGPGFEILLHTMVLFVMLFGLVGLIVPIFPGLTVMWLATLFFALMEAANERMAVIDWALFGAITLLMIGGNVVDNIIIAKKMRDVSIPWSSIVLSYLAGIIASIFLTPLVGLFAAPLALLGLEYLRLRDRQAAITATKAYVTGWGWAFAARFSIGIVMTGLWMAWAWF
jgi:uncharacterized protein YqgC (DUF456 family)